MKKDSTLASGLFLIGGAADTVHQDLVELAGGSEAKFILLPHASGVPEEVAESAKEKLEALGISNIEVIAHDDNDFSIPADTTCVYALGGDQSRLVRRLGTKGFQTLSNYINAGGLYAGTSAGSACVGQTMITGGMKDGLMVKGALDLDDGLGLISGLIVDQHFRNRNRFNRLLYATAYLKDLTGIGIDEDTGVLIESDGSMKVFGQGQVSVFEPGEGTMITGEDENQNVIGVSISCLSNGSQFELEHTQFEKVQ